MFRLDVLQSQWVIAALGGAAALVLGLYLAYQAGWSPAAGRVPRLLVVVYVLAAAFVLVYTAMAMIRPPNW